MNKEIKKLAEKFKELKDHNNQIEKRLWLLENPYKYNIGDKIIGGIITGRQLLVKPFDSLFFYPPYSKLYTILIEKEIVNMSEERLIEKITETKETDTEQDTELNELAKENHRLTLKVTDLEYKLFIAENPYKFKAGDNVIFDDEKCVVVEIKKGNFTTFNDVGETIYIKVYSVLNHRTMTTEEAIEEELTIIPQQKN